MKERIVVVGRGTIVSSNNKKGHGYYLLNAAGQLTDNALNFGKASTITAGGLYEIQYDPDEKMMYGDPSYLDMHQDDNVVAELKTLSKAAETHLKALSSAKKAKLSDREIEVGMRPLIRAYQSTNALGKMAIEVRLLHILRKGRDIEPWDC